MPCELQFLKDGYKEVRKELASANLFERIDQNGIVPAYLLFCRADTGNISLYSLLSW